MNRKRVNAEDRDQHEHKRDIYSNPVPCRQPLVGHNEAHRSDRKDDLKIPDLKEALSVLEQQRN